MSLRLVPADSDMLLRLPSALMGRGRDCVVYGGRGAALQQL
jgi:hypothetical protein